MTNDTKASEAAPIITRRSFVATTSVIGATALSAVSSPATEPTQTTESNLNDVSSEVRSHPFLTDADDFRDVSRGNPKPFTLQGEQLVEARLTPETWRLEIVTDQTLSEAVKRPAKIARSLKIDDGTALTFEALQELGNEHSVKFIKAMQCLNIPSPLGQGLWEGVPLREVLRLCGAMEDVRRVYYWGFHNNDPKQMFRSSLSYTQAMETAPSELPPFIAFKLNGEPIPLIRGGPVRMIIPWAHGFKSIKWLQRIVLTNDYRANDTYAEQNNDPESHLKTAAYIDTFPEQQPAHKVVFVSGLAISGLSGLERVEYWLRRIAPDEVPVTDDPSTWTNAKWQECRLEAPPKNWSGILPAGVSPQQICGFDSTTGLPRQWPLRYSMIAWSAKLEGLASGKYELRVRAIDENGFAQPEPRSILKTGRNAIEVKRFDVQ